MLSLGFEEHIETIFKLLNDQGYSEPADSYAFILNFRVLLLTITYGLAYSVEVVYSVEV